MDPVSSNTISNNCGGYTAGSCITYDKGAIPCLSICAGVSVSEVEFQIGMTVCNLIAQLNTLIPPVIPIIDFTKLSFGCLYTPTITVWTCPTGQTFLPDPTAFAYNGTPGFCQINTTPPALSTATPVPSTIPNPTPAPTTLLGVLQLLINAMQPLCTCDPCNPNKTGP